MNNYNVWVKNQHDFYMLSLLPEDDLLKIIEAYDNGKDAVFINGIERILTGLKEIKVFSYDEPVETWPEFINSQEARKYYLHSRSNHVFVGPLGLALKGSDLTKKYFNNDYGWKEKPESENIFMLKKHYIHLDRISALKELKSANYDFKKLVRICEEINLAYNLDSIYAVGQLLRALIDHVAPIFGYNTFKEVANNYSGQQSFKKGMQSLENSMRNIADSFLHTPIRGKEVLPTANQVEFMGPIDQLLAEIIRLTNVP
jgi:hypothetical protein